MSTEASPVTDPYYFNNPDLLTTLGVLGGNNLRMLSVTALAGYAGGSTPEAIYHLYKITAPSQGGYLNKQVR